jgi:ubiquinone/menaquinone biosynthesis C-methylase UbiE
MAESTPSEAAVALPWFAEHVDGARQILDFLAGEVRVKGARVADIGCGDGIIDLALCVEGRPARLVGYDLDLETDDLLDTARSEGYVDHLPRQLSFETSSSTHVPAADGSFDLVVSWSAFEHISEPTRMLEEIRRVLTPRGALFVQVWPFYATAHGSHLWPWYPTGWAHHLLDEDELLQRVREVDVPARRPPDYYVDVYRSLNHITADELGAHLGDTGFRVVKAELYHETVHIPPQLAHHPLSSLLISGVKLLARPR